MNRVPRLLIVALMAALALLGGPATGAFASGRDVLNDCTDDEVMQKTYTAKEYRDALNQLQGDTDEYGNCRDVIKRAALKAAAAGSTKTKDSGSTPAAGTGGSSGGAGAIGSAPAKTQLDAATPEERQAVDAARNATDGGLPADNTTIDTDKVGTDPGVSRVSDLPVPVVAVLALLLIAALALTAVRVRSLVDSRRT